MSDDECVKLKDAVKWTRQLVMVTSILAFIVGVAMGLLWGR